MDGWKRMLWTVGLVFVCAAGLQWINLGGDLFNTSKESWQIIVNAGAAGVVALIINAAAPWIKQYGYNAEPKQ